MGRMLRRCPSPAMIVALIALFAAVSVGTVYAASKINGKSVKKNSLPGNRIKTDSLTNKQIKESTLGTVPSATTAGNGFRAYGQITSTAPFFNSARSRNIASVTNPSIGTFCVAFASSAGINPATTGAAVSLNFGDDATVGGPPAATDKQAFAEWNSSATSGCPSGTMAFRTGYSQMGGAGEGNTNANEGFFFVVP